ncbi:MAG: anthranilate phosphoribosyltransferase [Deltaproteobacteria bacterium HGW-Deltaproteobacteria-6]|jgi:anthranilate phosphoribosyltransferase|nr:MAG: anthranilate phosphoribosyltransferase [Deltaproteobacteria bacterium HGW-Deltaproteobacteria-6]
MDQQVLKNFGGKIERLINGQNLTEEETYCSFKQVLCNEQPDLQQGAFLAALTAKGETHDEIVGAWRAIYEFDTIRTASDLPGPLFENSGTGMDGIKTFNVSSAAAIVAAACGVTMARHGARAITSACGTVDILEAVGIDVECDISTVEKSIRETGIGLFNGTSPRVHPGGLGRILSQIRFGSTLNIAASLAHPAKPSLALRGVYAESVMEKVAQVMQLIGYERGMVVHGRNGKPGAGMDEISPSGDTLVIEFSGSRVKRYTIQPGDAGIKKCALEDILATGSIRTEARRFVEVVSGRSHQPCIDFTCLNAGAILYVAGKAADLKNGVEMSRETIMTGRALSKLKEWRAVQGR